MSNKEQHRLISHGGRKRDYQRVHHVEEHSEFDRFLDRLSTLNKHWYLVKDDIDEKNTRVFVRIGCESISCPLTAVADGYYPLKYGDKWSMSDAVEAGQMMNLDKELIRDIIDAADGNEGYIKELRQQLLTACGLDGRTDRTDR